MAVMIMLAMAVMLANNGSVPENLQLRIKHQAPSTKAPSTVSLELEHTVGPSANNQTQHTPTAYAARDRDQTFTY
ncbi:hypothetical protein F4777DRAFT_563981 [Nemania sp. FL0916]|nr:hypothetical protein F4777DRAFT_563981 [Nemania sp. FL0916]